MNRQNLGRKCAMLVLVIGVVFLCGWSAGGVVGGIAFAAAIGGGTAVAMFSDTSRTCSSGFLRRRG